PGTTGVSRSLWEIGERTEAPHPSAAESARAGGRIGHALVVAGSPPAGTVVREAERSERVHSNGGREFDRRSARSIARALGSLPGAKSGGLPALCGRWYRGHPRIAGTRATQHGVGDGDP